MKAARSELFKKIMNDHRNRPAVRSLYEMKYGERRTISVWVDGEVKQVTVRSGIPGMQYAGS